MDCKAFFSLSTKTDKKACIYGAGEIGSFLGYLLVKNLGFEIDCYVDGYKKGKCNGIEIHRPEWLLQKKNQYTIFVAVEGTAGSEICDFLKRNKIESYVWLCEGGDEWLSEIGEYLENTNDIELKKKFNNFLDDKEYLKLRFERRMGYIPDFDNPKTFNEKLNGLRMHDHNPKYTVMADKYEVKDFIANTIGKNYVIPLLGVWDSFDDINFDLLPERFVLKCTHDSGSVVICKEKEIFDFQKARMRLEKRLKMNYFWPDREWVYRGIKKQIIAEEYVSDGNENLIPYKIFSFMGKPEIIQVIQGDKTDKESIDYFDTEWNLLDIRQNFPNSITHVVKPKELRHMLELSAKLSEGIPFVRTDFYVIQGKVIFSEFTFYSDSGAEKFHPEHWDRDLGDLIDIEGCSCE